MTTHRVIMFSTWVSSSNPLLPILCTSTVKVRPRLGCLVPRAWATKCWQMFVNAYSLGVTILFNSDQGGPELGVLKDRPKVVACGAPRDRRAPARHFVQIKNNHLPQGDPLSYIGREIQLNSKGCQSHLECLISPCR